MRWLSPPESVPAVRSSVRYSSPTFSRKASRSRISRRSRSAINRSCFPSDKCVKNCTACETESEQTFGSGVAPTKTERASGRSRAPAQAAHAVLLMYWRSPSRTRSLSVSR